MEPKNILNCQRNPEKKVQSWRYHASLLQTILQSHRNQNSMTQEQKQTYRSMEQNRELRNKPTHLWSINLQQRQQYIKGKRQSFQ